MLKLTKEEKAYLKVKTMINTHCFSKSKWTEAKQAKLDKAWNEWQLLLKEVK